MPGFAGYPLGVSANLAEEQWEDSTAEKERGSIMAGMPNAQTWSRGSQPFFSTTG